MLRLAAVVLSVGLADSINPSTVGPALYLATTPRRVRRVLEFTLGVFGVNLIAGVLLTVGPGRLLLDIVPHPRKTVVYALELAAGVVLMLVAAVVFARREGLAGRALPMQEGGGSALVVGASIAAIELPTALPYLGVIAAIVASEPSVVQAVGLLALFNLGFVAPLLAIVAILLVAGARADPLLETCAAWLQRRWPVVLATLLALVGAGLCVSGVVGLVTH